jgi:hypothetical protein
MPRIPVVAMSFAVLAACSSTRFVDPAAQREIAAKELGGARIERGTPCLYGHLAPSESRFVGQAGFCFVADGALYVRLVDASDPQKGRLLRLAPQAGQSFGLASGNMGAEELQLRTPGEVHLLVARPQGLGGADNKATEGFADLVAEWGEPAERAAEWIDQRPEGPDNSYAPIPYVPVRR